MSAKFTLEGSSAGAVQAIQQAADALDKTGRAAEGAAKSTRQLTNEAQRIKESLDPQERLNRKYQELQQHVEAGRISISQATAAGIKYRQELYATSEEGKKAAAAALAAGEASKKRAENERKSLQVQLDSGQRLLRLEKERAAAATQAAREQEHLVAAAQKIREAISPQEKLNRLTQELATHVKSGRLSIDEATTAHRKYRQELGLAAVEGEKVHGPSALASIGQMAAGYASAAAAVGLIVSGLKEKTAEDERAAQRAIQSRAGLGALSQLAAGEATPEAAKKKYSSLVAEARGMYAAGATETEGEAGALLFEMVSSDLGERDRAFATQLRAKGVLQNIGGAAGGFDALKTELGTGEVGSFREFMSKSLAAAKVAPGSFEELPVAAAMSGGSAKQLGVSDEFLLAATAIAGKARNSTSLGGTQVAAFLKQAEVVKGAQGLGGVALIEKIAGMSEKAQGYGGVLGDRSEAIQGFRVLRDNLPALRELEASIKKAQGSDLAGTAIGLPDTDDQGNAARTAFVAERRRELASNEASSVQRNTLNAMRSDRQTRLLEEGRTTDAAFERGVSAAGDWIPGFGWAQEKGLIAGGEDASAETRELMRRTAEAAERTEQQTRSKVATRPE